MTLKKSDVQFIADAKTKIKEFIGKLITVYVGGEARNNFETTVSVSGILEQHSESKDNYRVLVSETDNGTYSYFNGNDIMSVTCCEGHTFNNGSLAIVRLNIKAD